MPVVPARWAVPHPQTVPQIIIKAIVLLPAVTIPNPRPRTIVFAAAQAVMVHHQPVVPIIAQAIVTAAITITPAARTATAVTALITLTTIVTVPVIQEAIVAAAARMARGVAVMAVARRPEEAVVHLEAVAEPGELLSPFDC